MPSATHKTLVEMHICEGHFQMWFVDFCYAIRICVDEVFKLCFLSNTRSPVRVKSPRSIWYLLISSTSGTCWTCPMKFHPSPLVCKSKGPSQWPPVQVSSLGLPLSAADHACPLAPSNWLLGARS